MASVDKHDAALEMLLVAARRDCESAKGRTLPVKAALNVLLEYDLAGTRKEAAKIMDFFCKVGCTRMETREHPVKPELVYYIIKDPADSYPKPVLTDSQLMSWNVTFIDTSPLELARQLTLHELGFFKAIRRCDFAAVGEKAKPEPVQAWIDWNNKLTGWVVTEILMCNCELMRADVVVHFIDIARECHRMNNFSTMSTIAVALSCNDISRLAKLWQSIPKREMRHLEELCSICSVTGNFEKLRDAQNRAPLPKIPFLPPLLKDITLIKIGNEKVEDQEELMKPILDNLAELQSSKYQLLRLERFQRWLRDAIYVIELERRRQELSDAILAKLKRTEPTKRLRRSSGMKTGKRRSSTPSGRRSVTPSGRRKSSKGDACRPMGRGEPIPRVITEELRNIKNERSLSLPGGLLAGASSGGTAESHGGSSGRSSSDSDSEGSSPLAASPRSMETGERGSDEKTSPLMQRGTSANSVLLHASVIAELKRTPRTSKKSWRPSTPIGRERKASIGHPMGIRPDHRSASVPTKRKSIGSVGSEGDDESDETLRYLLSVAQNLSTRSKMSGLNSYHANALSKLEAQVMACVDALEGEISPPEEEQEAEQEEEECSLPVPALNFGMNLQMSDEGAKLSDRGIPLTVRNLMDGEF